MAQTYHLYADSYDFRAYMSGTDHVTDWDSDEAPIVRVLGSASKRIDSYLGRSFGIRTETHTYDIGRGALRNDQIFRGYGNEVNDLPDYWSSKLSGAGVIMLGDWLATATTVTAYGQTARTTSAVLTEGIGNDYLLEPYNRSPKTLLKLEEDTTDSLFGGQQTLTILGQWGWQTDTTSAAVLETAISSTTATAVVLTSGSHPVYAGDTIIIDTEQMYVSTKNGVNLTVIRGVNGTTAATHSDASVVSTWIYADDVMQATLDIARTYWRSRDAGLTSIIGTGEMGMSNPSREENAILKRLDHYRNSRETAVYV